MPNSDGRRADRRLVNIAASLREPGASLNEIEIVNLSVGGFAADVAVPLEVGSIVWLKLSGSEPLASQVVWVEDGKAGFEFTSPLHASTLDMLTLLNRRPVVKRQFGAQTQKGRAN
jgi:hypothetical protein